MDTLYHPHNTGFQHNASSSNLGRVQTHQQSSVLGMAVLALEMEAQELVEKEVQEVLVEMEAKEVSVELVEQELQMPTLDKT